MQMIGVLQLLILAGTLAAAAANSTLKTERVCLNDPTASTQVVNCCNTVNSCANKTLQSTIKYDCATAQSCSGATVNGATTRVMCAKAYACDSIIVNAGASLQCSVANACNLAWVKGAGTTVCGVKGGCNHATFQDGRIVSCPTAGTCNGVNIGPLSTMTCSGADSCNVLYIWGAGGTIKCKATNSCAGTTVTANEAATLSCSGTTSCKNSVIGCKFQNFLCSSKKTKILCTGVDSCDGAGFYGDFTTVQCAAGACTGATFKDLSCCIGAGCPAAAPRCT